MKRYLIAIALFLMLAISPSLASAVFTEPSSFSYNLVYQNSDERLHSYIAPSEKEDEQFTKKYHITVLENLALEKTQEKKFDQNNPTEKVARHIEVTVRENLNINSGEDPYSTFQLVKQNSDKKTIMERIWNSERIRFTGKSNVAENLLENDQANLFSESFGLSGEFENSELLNAYHATPDLPLLATSFLVKQAGPTGIVFLQMEGGTAESFVETFESMGDTVATGIYGLVDVKNPTVLLLLVPLAGLIFVRSEEGKFEFYNFQRISSLFLIIILLSSVITLPASVSTSYWNNIYVFAQEETGNGEINSDSKNQKNNLPKEGDKLAESAESPEVNETPPN